MGGTETETDPFTLAHLSDPHLTTLNFVRLRDLLSKRLLGYGSWHRRRRHEHRSEVLAALLTDLHGANPTHTVITGDMTHLGLPAECREVAEWLPRVGPPERVTVVPGNHDTYVRHRWDDGLALWHEYMASDDAGASPVGSRGIFPSLRVRGPLALIGLSSARPSAPLLAVGSVGKEQLRALAAILVQTAERGLCRILLIHHPPGPRTVAWRKRLTDAGALSRVIARHGVQLVLHGHSHRSHLGWVETPSGPAPAIGVRSASAIGLLPEKRAQYHLYRIVASAEQRSLLVQVREYRPERGDFDPADEWSAELP